MTVRMKATRAKLFQNGGSQAVRLPRDFAVHGLALGLTLVTNNSKHFGKVAGRETENWV